MARSIEARVLAKGLNAFAVIPRSLYSSASRFNRMTEKPALWIDLFQAFLEQFEYAEYLMDVYTERTVVFANSGEQRYVRGKTVLWGLSDPKLMERIPGVKHLRTYDFNYPRMLRTVPILTRLVYRMFYGKKSLNRLYRIYRFRLSRSTGDQ